MFEQNADKGWDFRHKIFQNQDALRTAGTNAPALLKQWAGEVGADQAALGTCVDSGKYLDRIQKEKQTAEQLKVPGTPSFFVGDQMVRGAGGGVPTVEEIGKAIDAAIAKKQGR